VHCPSAYSLICHNFRIKYLYCFGVFVDCLLALSVMGDLQSLNMQNTLQLSLETVIYLFLALHKLCMLYDRYSCRKIAV